MRLTWPKAPPSLSRFDLYIRQSYRKSPMFESATLMFFKNEPFNFRKLTIVLSTNSALHSFKRDLVLKIRNQRLRSFASHEQAMGPQNHYVAVMDILYHQMFDCHINFLQASHDELKKLVSNPVSNVHPSYCYILSFKRKS